MKLIYIANCRMPSERAHSKQIFKTAESLSRKVKNFELWLPDRPQLPQIKEVDTFEYYGSKKKFSIIKLPTLDYLNAINNSPMPIRLIVFLLEETSFLVSLVFNKPNCDIIYTRSFPVALVSKFLWSKKTYYEIHNFTANKLFALGLRKLDGVVAISHGLENKLHEHAINKTTVISDGVDLSEYKSYHKKIKTVIYTGGLTAEKGIHTLLASAKLLKNIRFLIAGGNYTSKKIVQGKNVTYLGILQPQNIAKILAQATVLVLPNSAKYDVSNLYTSPMKLFEYMASGTPIIATKTPANKEILTHLKNAYLVNPDDAIALADGIEELLLNSKLGRRLARQAKKDATKYSWIKRAEKIIKFINS